MPYFIYSQTKAYIRNRLVESYRLINFEKACFKIRQFKGYYCENDLVAPRLVLPTIAKNSDLYKTNKISDSW